MKPNEYWSSLVPEKKKALAVKLKTSVARLSNIFNGHIQAGPAFAKEIQRQTRGKVSKRALRPDD